jgi:predicted RNA methylase
MTHQDKGLKRDTIDKFYTKEAVVENCVNLIKSHIDINSNDLIIEPSAGGGAFIKYIKVLSNNQLYMDIAPHHKDVIKTDYLEFNEDISDNTKTKIHIIGNPPFGRQASMAKKFIKKSCEYADSVSFILPKSFKKESFQNTFPLNYHLIVNEDLPVNSFTINGIEYDVPCVFQIWIKKSFNREKKEKEIPNGFTFVKKNEQPDISFRRVGVYAGKVDTNTEDKSEQSHYFIKFTKQVDVSSLHNIEFDKDNTVGPRSISKPELIEKFNEIL